MWNFSFDQLGAIWTETRGQVYRWDRQQWTEVKLPANGIAHSSLFHLSDGSTLVLDRHTGAMHRWQAGTLTRHFDAPAGPAQIGTPMRTADGTFWFLGPGILRRPPQAGVWSIVAESTPLAHVTHRSVYEDREGSLWLGTDGAGLFRLRRRSVQALPTATSANHPIVLSVSGDAAGTVLAAVHGRGVHRHVGQGFSQLLLPNLGNDTLAWCIHGLPGGGALIGTYGQGLAQLTADGASLRHFRPD